MSSSQTSFVGNIRTSLSDWSFSRSIRNYSKATLDHMFLDAVEHLDYSKIHLLVAHDKDVVLRHSEAITKSTEDSPLKIRNLVKAFDFGDKIPAGLVLYAAIHNHVNWTQQLLDAGYPLLRGNASVPKSAGAAGSSEVILSFKSKDAQYIAFLTAIVAGQEKCVLTLLDAGVDKHKFERPERFLFSQRRSMNDAAELTGTGEILNLTPIETACLYGRVGILDCLIKHAEKRVDQKSIDNALTMAVKRENSAIYRSLVDAGANIDHSEGELLRYAIKDRSVTRTAFLLQEGVNVRSADINVANTMIREPVRYRDEIPIVPQDAMEEEHLWQFADGVEIPAMQVAHRQGQNTSETSIKSFLIVALTALDDAAKVPTYLPTSTPRILKTDAFHSIPNSERNYLTSIGVNASLVATVIADYDTAKATKYLGHLVSNDVKRVEETKGLTYSRYLRGIREQTMPFLDFRDVIREFSEVIILPALICNHFARLGSLPHQGELNELSAKAKSIAANYIVQDKNTLALMVLNAKWHRAGNRCPMIFDHTL